MLAVADAPGGKKAKRDKTDYAQVRRAEIQYSTKLRKIARHVGDIINAFAPGDPKALPQIKKLLGDYSKLLKPWAEVTAASMLADVGARDRKLWAEVTKGMSQALRLELQRAPMGAMFRQLQAEQVSLIQSIPTEAAERVHKLTMEAQLTSARAEEIANEIRRSGKVTESRANLIARTEVGRASTNLGMARAIHVGSEGYIWRTAMDTDVRNKDGNPVGSHRLLEGIFIRWDSPPVVSTTGVRAHAGCWVNCRCYPEIILPDGHLV